MILWINGAFGSGKTQTAFELNRRIPQSFVFDPENAGYYIQKNIPLTLKKNDFQNYPQWREFNYSMLRYIASGFEGIIIVPMTIVEPDYFREIAGRLNDDGIQVHHFTLCVSREQLLSRLRSRGEGQHSWAAKQIDRCLKGHQHPIFAEQLVTDNMSIEQVAEAIAAKLQISLLPAAQGRVRRFIQHLKVKYQHIRLINR
ncbi:AAA family ATPase [Paenibacillus jilunlii]|uniref:AAA domain-containing protein n=1 Tax=Paenibacillus jilunlii TaxID=682956 RepID=A0A1G9V2M5_9BACL|nr:AAA family ATPase [Paenibacillus jilunlii]KWX80337.1 tunicamycin resistance protein [Paenibacillus jilunlii]SDM66379.1 AAA domain-containing protein [Paenibacillus jilunlii]